MQINYRLTTKRATYVAIALFLFFEAMALGLNLWLSWRIEHDAVLINLAGRQRMLSQRMVKVLLQMQAAAPDQVPPALHDELRQTFQLFDDTQTGFTRGGTTQDGDLQPVLLRPLSSPANRRALDAANHLWHPYRTQVLRLLKTPHFRLYEQLPATVAIAQQTNLPLLASLNTLTSSVEASTRDEAGGIRIILGFTFSIALLNAAVAFALFTRRAKQAEQQHALLDSIINRISASILVMDPSSRILQANPSAEQLFGYRQAQLYGQTLSTLLTPRADTDYIGRRQDGSQFDARCEQQPVSLDGQRLLIATIRDVTLQRQTEARLSDLAYHDLLTGLPNRLLFDDRLKLEIAHAQRRRQRLAVLFLDLDQFKPVNDTYGHEMGDHLLCEVAKRLRQCIRESDTLSRRGGDEFTLLLCDIASRSDVEHVASQLLAHMHTPFMIQHTELHIGASIGIALYPDDGNEAEWLLSRADEAMYRAKEHGRGRYMFIEDAIRQDQAFR